MNAEDALAAAGAAAGSCPYPVDRPVMMQRWERLTFLHWPFEPKLVQDLLPGGLRAETFGGTAWVGLVPFFMRAGTAGGHRAPWASNFCETNVRTYVRDRDGQPGIWFFSLEAARLGAVATARAGFRLPYFWSAMRLSERGSQVAYTCRRRSPGACTSRVRVRVGAAYQPGEASERDHFLTARWMLFSVAGARYRFARACHEPWPLYHADAEVVDDQLVRAAGLPQPEGPPLVHYSPGVNVRIGWPEKYR
jgi:uncharacterized protein YqjF (DUF2071 family)